MTSEEPAATAASQMDLNASFTTYEKYKLKPEGYAICQFCKWEMPYSIREMEDHLGRCEGHKRSQTLKGLRSEIGPLLVDLAAPTGSVEEMALRLLRQFDNLRSERFQREMRLRRTIEMDEMSFWQEYQNWRLDVEKGISQLRNGGQADGAQRLARALLDDHFNYGNFELRYGTPTGQETFTVIGLDPCKRMWDDARGAPSSTDIDLVDPDPKRHPSAGSADSSAETATDSSSDSDTGRTIVTRGDSEARSDSPRPTGAQLRPDLAQFLSLAEPVAVDAACGGVAITLNQAREDMQWICRSSSGVAFCVRCDCPKTVAPALEPDPATGATCVLVTTFFNSNPFEQGRALAHFRDYHGQLLDEQEMVTRHGSKVKPTARSSDGLQTWQIAAHNHTIQLRHEQMALEWERRLRDGVDAADDIPLKDVSRTVAASMLEGRDIVFRWGRLRWTVLCPDPTCIEAIPRLSSYPLRAMAHFQKHGIPVASNHDVLALFGCKVLGDLPSRRHASSKMPSKRATPQGDRGSGALKRRLRRRHQV